MFVRVTTAGVEAALAGWVMTTPGGLSVTRAEVASPLRVTCCGPPTASLGITTVPVWPPGSRGWNATSNEQLIPGSSRACAQEFFAGSR